MNHLQLIVTSWAKSKSSTLQVVKIAYSTRNDAGATCERAAELKNQHVLLPSYQVLKIAYSRRNDAGSTTQHAEAKNQ